MAQQARDVKKTIDNRFQLERTATTKREIESNKQHLQSGAHVLGRTGSQINNNMLLWLSRQSTSLVRSNKAKINSKQNSKNSKMLMWLSRQSTSLVRTRSRVQVPSSAPKKPLYLVVFLFFSSKITIFSNFKKFIQVQLHTNCRRFLMKYMAILQVGLLPFLLLSKSV